MNERDNEAMRDDVAYSFWESIGMPGAILREIHEAMNEVMDGSGFATGLWFKRTDN